MRNHAVHTEEYKQWRRVYMTAKWKDPLFREKMAQAYQSSHHKVRYYTMKTYPHVVLDIFL